MLWHPAACEARRRGMELSDLLGVSLRRWSQINDCARFIGMW